MIIIALVPTAKNNLYKKRKYPNFTIDNNDRTILKCFSVLKSLIHYLVYGVHVLYPKILKLIQCFSKNYN